MTGAEEDNDKLGEFPFPLTDGPKESVYLTWLRNHSNYLAARGFLDYLRSVSVLVRGIIVNFLIFLPYILLIAVALGYAHYWMLDNPFSLTLFFLVLAIVWILLFPVLMRLYKILYYTRSVETGTESTVGQRDRYERSFGALLLLILATAFLESQPWILELGHNFFRDGDIGWQQGLASVAAVLALLSGSDKVLSVLSGVQKRLAMIVIGLLGLLVPLLVIIFTTVFLVYGLPPSPIVMYSPLFVAVAGVLAILVAIALGVWRRAFTPKEFAGVVGLLLVGLILVAGVVITTGSASEKGDRAFSELQTKIEPLQRVAAAFENVSNKHDLTPDLSALVDEFVVVQHEYNIMVKDVDNEYIQFEETHKSDLDLLEKADDKLTWFEWLKRPLIKWELKTKEAEFIRRYFASAQQFINLGNDLSALPRGRLQPLRREVARLAHEQLHDVADVMVTKGKPAKLTRRKLAFWQLLAKSIFGSPSNSKIDSASRRRDTDTEADKTRLAKGNFATSMRGKLLEQALRVPDSQTKYDPGLADRMVKQARQQAELNFNVQHHSVGELVRLVGVERLENKLHQKVWDRTGKQELAKITGKVELANLVSDQEIVELVFSESDLPLEALKSAATNLCIHQLIGGNSVDDSRLLKYAGELDDERLSQELIGSLDVEYDEVRSVASRELAELALSNFNAQQLAIILQRPRSDLNEVAKRQQPAITLQSPSSDPIVEAKRQQFSDLQLVASRVGFEKLTRLALESVDVSDESNLPANVADKVQDFSRPQLFRFLLAEMALGDDPKQLDKLVREKLTRMSLGKGDGVDSYLSPDESRNARNALGEMMANTERDITYFTEDELATIAVAKFGGASADAADKLVATLMFGKYGPLERALPGGVRVEGELGRLKQELTEIVMLPKAIFVVLLALVTWCVCWFTVDVNLTSIHGFNRDRLATAFLVGRNTDGNVDIEEDIDLEEICRHEARSTAPYHLVNVALNLQGSSDIGIRDRKSDFFIFSKRFIGGERTGYCRSETMEHVYPQISLATAMAVSAAAASPNMGRGTSPLLVAFMTLLNIRMGYWSPNPGLLEEMQDQKRWKQRIKDAKKAKQPEPSRERDEAAKRASLPLGFTYQEVFAQELTEVLKRWEQVDDPIKPQRRLVDTERPSVSNRLFGIAYSGGGIRSATINLGITQALHKCGVFEHADYMSTVSGGGYLGASLSTLMRTRTKLQTEIAGTVSIHMDKLDCEIAGTVQVTLRDGEQVVTVTPESVLPKGSDPSKEADWSKEYWFSADTVLNVKDGGTVKAGDALVKHRPAITVKDKPLDENATDVVSKTVEAVKPEPITVDQVVVVKPTGHGESKRYRFSKDAKLNVTDKENVSAGKPLMQVRGAGNFSEIAGTVSVEEEGTEYVVSVQSRNSTERKVYRFSRFARLVVCTGDEVIAGQPLVQRQNSVGGRFRWRVRPTAFLREMLSKLDENRRWVNLSDGGHLENLATIELLRRRCKYIIIGDGEADPNLHFNGLATLKRTARIDLGIEIDINLNPLRLKAREGDDKPTVSTEHWAIGEITYPELDEDGKPAIGYLLYLKSSYTGDEGEVITEYRHRNPSFPHETTADQFFDEGQFEAYRALGQHIAEQALDVLGKCPATKTKKLPFSELDKWLTGLWNRRRDAQETGDGSPATKG